MKIDGTAYRTIWVDHSDGWSVRMIDQTKLPWALAFLRLTGLRQAAHAIRSMQVRGAPLIGATAAYGLALASGRILVPTRWSVRRATGGDPPDRDQSALGAGSDAHPPAQHRRHPAAPLPPTPRRP